MCNCEAVSVKFANGFLLSLDWPRLRAAMLVFDSLLADPTCLSSSPYLCSDSGMSQLQPKPSGHLSLVTVSLKMLINAVLFVSITLI